MKKTKYIQTSEKIRKLWQRFIAKSFILIDRCQKKGKKHLLHLWDENEWQNMVDFIDTSFKDTKDENIKELREIATSLLEIDNFHKMLTKEFMKVYKVGREEMKKEKKDNQVDGKEIVFYTDEKN